MPALYESDEEGEAAMPSFGLNKTFAEAYETKKRTEELSKLQDKYGKDYSLSDAEDEEEDLSDDDSDAELVTPQVDAAILRTLAKIRQKDPSVYEEGREVFDEEESRTASTSTLPAAKSKASKPVLLKDYQRSRMIADPTASLPDEVNPAGFARTFAQEEIDLKAEVTKAFGASGDQSDSDDDDLLVPREKTKDEREREDEEYAKFLKANVGDREVEDALEQEEKFLRDYILTRGWIDRSGNKSRIPSYNEVTGGGSPPPEKKPKKEKKEKKPKEVVIDVDAEEGDEPAPDAAAIDSDDSEFEDRADEFEHKYNFRFEEAAGPTITTHSRTLAASTARRPTAVVSARARARDAAKEKAEEEKVQRREEVRRLKSLKRKEVEDKLHKILEAAGAGAAGLDGVDLDGDWDPEAHDRKMAEIYGEDYVGAEDDDFKPAWDDDIDISDLQAAEDAEGGAEPEAFDASASVGAEKKARKDKGKRKREEEGFPTALLEAAKNGGDAERKALLESMVDEYYGLDYEDKIGDLAVRFKYAKVAPSSFALTPVEILMATDAELNSYVSLRKMAPYRKDGDGAGGKKAKDKKRLKELRDALRDREWGVELDLDEDGEPVRKSKKPKWSEETGRGESKARLERPPKAEGAPAKRVGKKERSRKKAEAAAGGEA